MPRLSLLLMPCLLCASVANAQTPTPPSGQAQPPTSAYAYPPPPPAEPPAQLAAPPGAQPPFGYPAPPYRASYAVMGRPGAETHDGFFLRLQLGGGFTTMSASAGSSSISVSGGGAAFSAAFGGAVAPNMVLYGAVMDSLAANPEVKVDGTSLGNGDGSAGVVGFGPGIGYYFEPSNVFLGATLLFSKLVIDDKDGNKIGESEWGATFAGQVGKEWWVSDNWGLGVSAQLMLGAMKDKEPIATGGEVPSWTVAAFSLLFSATYN